VLHLLDYDLYRLDARGHHLTSVPLRNGPATVELARRAERFPGGRLRGSPQFVETLRTAKKTLSQAQPKNDQPIAERLCARLALYQLRQPFREAVTVSLPEPVTRICHSKEQK
jgi:hypothetical protein